MLPEIVLGRSKGDLHKRPPLRPLRFADQAHVRFSREPVALTRIARDTGANHVFPVGGAAPIARHDMIQIELAPIEQLPAILTGVLVTFEDIVPGKLYLFFREPIEDKQHDHPRNPDFECDCSDHFMLRGVGRQIAPAFEIVRQEVVRVVRRNNLGVPGVYQREGAASRADVHRLPEPVQH